MWKVRSFYKDKHESLRQSAKALHDYYDITAITDLDFASGLEVLELRAAFIELRCSLKRLLWYWLVNFDKILGSLAKFQGDLGISDADLAIRNKSVEDLCRINDWLERLQPRDRGSSRGSTQTTLLQRKHLDGSLFKSPLYNVFAAIEKDDALALDQQLTRIRSISEIGGHSWQHFLFALLQTSTVNGSQCCSVRLLSDIGSFQDFGNHIHWLIIKIGRSKILQNQNTQVQNLTGTVALGTTLTEIIDELAHSITTLGPKLEKALQKKDSFGRVPLHHAVQYDLPQVCREILKHMRDNKFPSPALIPDWEGLTSLDLAVLHGNVVVLALLLEDHHRRTEVTRIEDGRFSHEKVLPGRLLTIALGLESIAIIRLLHRSVIDVKHRDHNGNTALYLAVRSRRIEYVTEILQGCNEVQKVDLDAREVIYGWTPLILASARGDLAIVELLLQAGADPTTRDHIGWRAKDHAAFRGWLSMAKKLTMLTARYSEDEDQSDCLHQRRQPTVKTSFSGILPENHSQTSSPNQSQIYVNLGALDTYKPVTAVDMSPYVWPDPYDPQREADFHVEIRCVGGDRARNVVQLPILEDMANKPWLFVSDNPKNSKLAFNIYHSKTSGFQGDPLIGSAVALLDSLKQGLSPARESLIRNFTIPVLHKDTLDFIGTVTFYFLVMTPFPHPDPKQVIKQELSFPSSNSLPIIGHRGTLEPSF